MEIIFCPICGFGPFTEPYQSIQELRSSFEICDCCGCEYGNDDTESYFEKWKSDGGIWFDKKQKPKNWVLENQIGNIIRPWIFTNV